MDLWLPRFAIQDPVRTCRRCKWSARGYRHAMKIRSLLLMVVAASAIPLTHTGGYAFATDYCVELTAGEFNRRAERRGDYDACAGSHPSNIEDVARDRSRSNANNAIASQCRNNVTPNIQQRACSRINLAANTSSNPSWAEFPPTSKPEAQKVRYIGQGIGAAAGVNLCVMAHDLRIRTRNVVDGRCSHNSKLMPHRLFVTARAWARCAVLCSAP